MAEHLPSVDDFIAQGYSRVKAIKMCYDALKHRNYTSKATTEELDVLHEAAEEVSKPSKS